MAPRMRGRVHVDCGFVRSNVRSNDRTVGFFVGFFSGLVGSHGERPTTRNAIHDDLITVRYNVDEPNPMGGLDATPNFDADQKRESRNEKQRHEVVRTQSRRRLTQERQQ